MDVARTLKAVLEAVASDVRDLLSMRVCRIVRSICLCVLVSMGLRVQGQSLATVPEAPQPTPAKQLQARPVLINGRPYVRPTQRQLFLYYLNDSYGATAFANSTVRAVYSQLRGKPTGWGTDFPGFGQRYGSAVAVSAINGNVRYGMEELFHEDLRYIPCHGCSAKHKIENALLAEITARHDNDGHRFFTLTPTVADFSGPIIAHSVWYPGGSYPWGGVVATRTVFATRVGLHLFREFVIERRHHDVREPQNAPPSPKN